MQFFSLCNVHFKTLWLHKYSNNIFKMHAIPKYSVNGHNLPSLEISTKSCSNCKELN